MYDTHDKRRLYWLIDQYLSGALDEDAFCNEYHVAFVVELDLKVLSELEYTVFSELSEVSERFSPFKEDFALWAGFVTAEQLREKVAEAKERLEDQDPR